MTRRSTVGTVIYLLIGPIAWGLHAALIYAVQSTLCAMPGAEPLEGPVQLFIVIVTIVAVVLVAAGALKPDSLAVRLGAGAWPAGTLRFQRQVMTLLALLSLFGIVAAGVAAAFLPACALLR